MKCNIYSVFRSILQRQKISERTLEGQAKVSRTAIRRILSLSPAITLQSLAKVAETLDCEVDVIVSPKTGKLELSSGIVSQRMVQDGFASWKIHLMDWVDEVRRSRDPYLLLFPPVANLDEKLKSLMASIALQLSEELAMSPPAWATKIHFLPKPWFVSGVESLKAFSLLESPWAFRRNNIFVQENFLKRA